MMNKTIPTILGLALLVAGVGGGVYLIQNTNSLSTRASNETTPKNIKISNITHNSFTVSWATSQPTTGMVKWGADKNNIENIAINSNAKTYTHYIKINNLTPSTEYYFQVYSNSKNHSLENEPYVVSTGKEIAPKPVTELTSGKIITQSGLEVENALVYVNIPGGSLLSDITTQNGDWIIPISNMRSKDLSNYLKIDPDVYLDIFVDAGALGTSQVSIKASEANPVPPIELGKVSDFSNSTFEFRDDIPGATLNNEERQVKSYFDHLFN